VFNCVTPKLINAGYSFTEIIHDYYPALTEASIHACLDYAIALIAAEEIHLQAVA
jgi:uncharacterized protein (DUF433 family)